MIVDSKGILKKQEDIGYGVSPVVVEQGVAIDQKRGAILRSNCTHSRVLMTAMVCLLFMFGCAPVQSPGDQPLQASPQSTSSSTETTDESDGPIELVVWGSIELTQSGESAEYGQYVKEQFEREHPGVEVRLEYQGWDEALRLNLFNALLAGTPPDIVVGENYFQYFAELGALYPLDDLLAGQLDNLLPATYRAASYDGHIYGVSAFTGVFGFERNCAVIEAAGLDCDTPPETWADLREQARRVTEAGMGEYYGYTLQGPGGTALGSVFRIACYLAQMDVLLCQGEDCSYPYFNDPNSIPALELIRDLNKYTPPGLTLEAHEGMVYMAMYEGLSAYQIAGSWHPGWAEAEGCSSCQYSPIPVAEEGHPASLVVGNTIYAVLNQSKHPELAAEWVAFLARDDVQRMVYPALGRLPATRSALTELRPDVDPATQTFIDELLLNESLQILPQFRKDPQRLWSIYNQLLADVLTTERPIQQLIDEAQAQADMVMSQ